MAHELVVRIGRSPSVLDLPALLEVAGDDARPRFEQGRARAGVHLLLGGDRSYYLTLRPPVSRAALDRLSAGRGQRLSVIFPGRTPVRRLLEAITVTQAAAPSEGVALDLTNGLPGAPPLWLLADGRLALDPTRPEEGLGARRALINAARWVSTRRTTSFERLFPPSAFHPDQPLRPERLTVAQGHGLLTQVRGALRAAAVGSDGAKADPAAAAEVRSAGATVLSHLLATVLRDQGMRALADQAAAELFALVAAEQSDPTARPALRAHVINLLQLRGPALGAEDKKRARDLLRGLVRVAPPYAELKGPWRFAMCSDWEFHEGECDILVKRFKFTAIPIPGDAPKGPHGSPKDYKAFEAPWKNAEGNPIQIFARAASPSDENFEMGQAGFVGLLINRHAQLGSFDMRASTVRVEQAGYKLMMNSQCAGLTTRFAITRLFPDADVYSSWDSTYFNTDGPGGKVTASEGLDCFVAVLEGMAKRETHQQLDQRSRRAQWYHKQERVPDFSQFVGPAHPLVLSRFNDINQDGRADLYDGYLDFALKEIAEDVRASATPRDPGVAATQLGGEAAKGLGWASGSLNRVAQYSDIWSGLPGEAELLYSFQSGGFYSHLEPPVDVPMGALAEPLGRLPAVVRYSRGNDLPGGLAAEVMFHAWLAHAAKEFKRLVCAGEALWRALDLGHLPKQGLLATPLGQRGAVLLTLAGLLDYPADQNYIDGLWSLALQQLNFPDISRSVVRACITSEDHDASNYYGSYRGLRQLVGEGAEKGAIEKADPVLFGKLKSDDPAVGRAKPLPLP